MCGVFTFHCKDGSEEEVKKVFDNLLSGEEY